MGRLLGLQLCWDRGLSIRLHQTLNVSSVSAGAMLITDTTQGRLSNGLIPQDAVAKLRRHVFATGSKIITRPELPEATAGTSDERDTALTLASSAPVPRRG